MAIPSPLSRKLRDKLGADAGEALVTWLEEMRAEHRAEMAKRDEEMARRDQEMVKRDLAMSQMRADIDARFQANEARLVERMNGLELRLTQKIGDVKSDLMKWSFVFWSSAVFAVAALAGVLRT